jgi:hypothetical protein
VFTRAYLRVGWLRKPSGNRNEISREGTVSLLTCPCCQRGSYLPTHPRRTAWLSIRLSSRCKRQMAEKSFDLFEKFSLWIIRKLRHSLY